MNNIGLIIGYTYIQQFTVELNRIKDFQWIKTVFDFNFIIVIPIKSTIR